MIKAGVAILLGFILAGLVMAISLAGMGAGEDTGFAPYEDVGIEPIDGYGTSGDYDSEVTYVTSGGGGEDFTTDYNYDVGGDYGYSADYGADGGET